MAHLTCRILFLLPFGLFLASALEAGCSSTTPGTTHGNNINVTAGSGVSGTLLNAAINKWKMKCPGKYGISFPAFNSGGPGISYTAIRKPVNLTSGDCGVISGDSISIYDSSKPNGPTGPAMSCGDMTSVLAHELGHSLRLNDASAGCSSHIMATEFNPGTVRTVQPDECSAADERWITIPEIDPPDPDDDDGLCTPASGEDCLGTPLVFDVLNTGGINATNGRDPRVPFDIDGDVRRESSQWVAASGGDAFLWLDIDGDGKVDGGRELFGDATVLPDGTAAEHGFEALAAHDTDQNGVIDVHDVAWPHLLLWTDVDMDGQADEGESRSLDDAGIASIALQFVERRIIDDGGNVHRFWGTYKQRAPSGKLRDQVVVDVFFKYRDHQPRQGTVPN